MISIITKIFIDKAKTNGNNWYQFRGGTTLNSYSAVKFLNNTIQPDYYNGGQISSSSLVYTDVYYR